MTAPARIQRQPLQQVTSREAFRDRPQRTVDEQILDVVRELGGAADHEIEARTGLKHQTISGNRRHLVERGKLHASDERRPTPSGRNAIVWCLGAGDQVPPFIRPNAITEQIELPGVRSRKILAVALLALTLWGCSITRCLERCSGHPREFGRCWCVERMTVSQ